jgi:glycosyltransferase involved in cell wall biosynthesis
MIKEISVFLPAYNDEKTIQGLVLDAVSVLEPLGLDYEIIVIDDASPDNTAEVVGRLEKDYPRVRLLQHKKNRDYGGVLKSGFAQATKNWIFYTDGDGQYDIKEITRLLPYAPDYDLVNGYIIKRRDQLYRLAASKMYQFFLEIFFGKTLIYTNCDFRLVRKEAVSRIQINSDSGFAPAEMIIKLLRSGARVKEVEVSHSVRRYGHSQFLNFKKLFNITKDMIQFILQK